MKRLLKGMVVCLAAAAVAGCGGKSKTATVTIRYTSEPTSKLSEQHMHIAVYNTDVIAAEGSDSFDEKKWREMTADFVQSELQNAADKHGLPIKLVDREHIKATLGEKDMASAGLTDSGDAMASSALQGATAILTSRVTIKVDKQSKTEYKQGTSFRGFNFGGGEKTEERRTITVTSQFQLKDAGTNEVIFAYSGRPQSLSEGGRNKNPFFGKSKTEVEMTPRDEVIGTLVEQHLRSFMSKFAPVTFEATMDVESGKTEASTQGVNILVTATTDEEFQSALDKFKVSLSEKPEDDKTLFAAGVCCERLQQPDEALRYYKQARAIEEKEEKYIEAVQRLENRVG